MIKWYNTSGLERIGVRLTLHPLHQKSAGTKLAPADFFVRVDLNFFHKLTALPKLTQRQKCVENAKFGVKSRNLPLNIVLCYA